MTKLAVLLDSDTEEKTLDKLIKNLNKLTEVKNIEVWVGCSKEKGPRTKEIIKKIGNKYKKILFPGNIKQGLYASKLVDYVLVPTIKTGRYRYFFNIFSWLGEKLVKGIYNAKTIKYDYIVPNSGTKIARKLGVFYRLTNEELEKKVDNCLNGKSEYIYIDFGSGSKENLYSRLDVLDLIYEKVKETNKKLIVGGGVTLKYLEKTKISCDTLVISTYFEKHPEDISKVYNILKFSNN